MFKQVRPVVLEPLLNLRRRNRIQRTTVSLEGRGTRPRLQPTQKRNRVISKKTRLQNQNSGTVEHPNLEICLKKMPGLATNSIFLINAVMPCPLRS